MIIQQALFNEPEIDIENNKKCDYCYKWKHHSCFDLDCTKNDGYDHRCKECKSKERILRVEMYRKIGVGED